MRQPRTKMCWHLAILVTLSLSASYTRAEEVTNICDTAQFFTTTSNLDNNIKEWEANSESKTDQLQKLSEKFAEILGTTADCPSDLKPLYESSLTFGIKLIQQDYVSAEKALPLIPEEPLDAIIISLISRIEPTRIVDFVKNVQDSALKKRVYTALVFILGLTNLNNKMVDTNVPFFEDLNKIAQEETDEELSVMLKFVRRAAIKADIRLGHQNLDDFYKIDHDLTSEVVQDFIEENIARKEKCKDDDEEPLLLYNILKTSENHTAFNHHLELIFNELKKQDKLKTIHSLVFLDYLEDFEDSDKEHWLGIVNQFPEMSKDIYNGIICHKTVDGVKTNKIFKTISKDGNKVKKFESGETGAKTLLTATLDDEGDALVLVADKLSSTEHTFDFPVEIQHGDLLELSGEAASDATSYECQQLKDIMERTSITSYSKSEAEHYCRLKKVVEGLLNAF